ncbi:hypothetical protein [Ensifer aridi]|uniref:hypothetical protein n=1 Tax=Ensifer aridi TaxID=1708715 RepID=UPI000A11A381|nr:hypothetical protein [Ensifer aridi]
MTLSARQLAQQRVASLMDPAELEAVARIKALNSCHIKSARDAEAQKLYRKLVRNTQTETAKQVGLIIMGNSGSRKTHIIRSMEKVPEFRRYREPGEDLEMPPYLSVDAPPTVTSWMPFGTCPHWSAPDFV